MPPIAIEIGVQQSFGAAGCPFKTENARQLLSGAVLVLAMGWHMIITSANDVVEYSPNAGTTWRTIIPANAAEIVFSDGFNVRFRNTGVADSGAVNSYDTLIDKV